MQADQDLMFHLVDGGPALLAMIAAYFVPAIVAFFRRHPNRWAILVVLLMGAAGAYWAPWTLLAWPACLIWAILACRQRTAVSSADGPATRS